MVILVKMKFKLYSSIATALYFISTAVDEFHLTTLKIRNIIACWLDVPSYGGNAAWNCWQYYNRNKNKYWETTPFLVHLTTTTMAAAATAAYYY
jgi:hypothetical protein